VSQENLAPLTAEEETKNKELTRLWEDRFGMHINAMPIERVTEALPEDI